MRIPDRQIGMTHERHAFRRGRTTADMQAAGIRCFAICYSEAAGAGRIGHRRQRGPNENTNGLLRQYFPKGKSLDAVTDKDVAFAVNRLNTRPRKCLDWQTPHEALKAAAKKHGV